MPTKTDTVRGLHAKLAEVMAEAGRIPKNGQYQGQGAFKYVMVGDAADAIRKALGERKVSMLPSQVDVVSEAEHATKSGGTMTTITIRTTWTLVDGETGETATIQSIGTGADSGDKASPKAQTNAMKYALLMGFLLSTGDDPEQSDSSDRQSKAVGQERLDHLGNLQKAGKVAKGGPDQYQGEFRQTPDGRVIGFRLNIEGDDKSIPQVVVTGPIGDALYMALGEESLIGQHITVKGQLYNVRAEGRATYYRLIVGERPTDFIETEDFRIPARPEDAGATETAAEAETLPAFDLDAVDREDPSVKASAA